MPSPVILILGAGPNIGHHVAKTFAAGGYKVAIAARSVKEAESTDSQLNIPSDFTKSDDVVNAFSKVKKVFGIPSVVVYNGKPPSSPALPSFLVLIKPRSQRLDAPAPRRPVLSPLRRFQQRSQHQCYESLRRRATGCRRLRAAACGRGADVHHDGQYPERGDHPGLYLAGRGEVRGRTHDVGCCGCV